MNRLAEVNPPGDNKPGGLVFYRCEPRREPEGEAPKKTLPADVVNKIKGHFSIFFSVFIIFKFKNSSLYLAVYFVKLQFQVEHFQNAWDKIRR